MNSAFWAACSACTYQISHAQLQNCCGIEQFALNPEFLIHIHAHLLRNTCKILFAPGHLSSCALPPQGLHHGQTQVNLLFKIGWVCHEHLSFQSRSIAFENQPSCMESCLV